MAKSNKPIPKKAKNIYLDYAASAVPNPGSIHNVGVKTKQKLEKARQEVATLLSARPQEIIFTSGGTESNNLAIQGIIHLTPSPLSLPRRGGGERSLPHIITTNIEHPSVLETCKLLEERKLAEISIVAVEANGIVDPKKIKKEIKENTVLVSVMYANNEIGTIQPIKEIGKVIRHYKKTRAQSLAPSAYPFFHADAVQGINYLDMNVERLGVDMLTLSGAKVEGGGRVGVLYKKASVPLAAIFGGGDQEFGLRPGTENWPEIIKFADAFSKAQKGKDKESARLSKLRDYFIISLLKIFPRSSLPRVRGGSHTDEKFQEASFWVNGDLEKRLPNNVNITIQKIPSDLLVIELSARGIMASSKSACKSGSGEGSYVIRALRPEADPEIGGFRFSLGSDTKKEDINYVVKSLEQILKKLEKWYH